MRRGVKGANGPTGRAESPQLSTPGCGAKHLLPDPCALCCSCRCSDLQKGIMKADVETSNVRFSGKIGEIEANRGGCNCRGLLSARLCQVICRDEAKNRLSSI